MLQLNKLEKLTKDRKRVGRGGDLGGTSGRGHKGQRARTGSISEIKPWFEGGQMPMVRRTPRRGFTNPFKKDYKLINIVDLERVFDSGDTVNQENLKEKGLLKGKKKNLIKILGDGKLTKNLIVYADAFSNGAVEAIKKAGGKVEIVKEA